MDLIEYYWMATAIAFIACVNTPSKSLSEWDQFWTSAVLSLLLGWALWPFAVIGAVKCARRHNARPWR
jgi:hypothetical protein